MVFLFLSRINDLSVRLKMVFLCFLQALLGLSFLTKMTEIENGKKKFRAFCCISITVKIIVGKFAFSNP